TPADIHGGFDACPRKQWTWKNPGAAGDEARRRPKAKGHFIVQIAAAPDDAKRTSANCRHEASVRESRVTIHRPAANRASSPFGPDMSQANLFAPHTRCFSLSLTLLLAACSAGAPAGESGPRQNPSPSPVNPDGVPVGVDPGGSPIIIGEPMPTV